MAPARTLKLFAPRVLPAEKLKREYSVLAFSAGDAGFTGVESLGALRFDEGRLFVDELPILRPRLGSDALSWSQQTPGHFTSGHLYFARGGTELQGLVYRGTTPSDAQEHHVLATSIPVVDYQTRITKKRYPAGTQPDSVPADQWQDGLKLEMSYEQNPGDVAPHPVVRLDGIDISDWTTWSIDQTTQQTVLYLLVDPDLGCAFDPNLYLTGQVAFDILQVLPTFAGSLGSTCPDPSGSGSYLWTGTAVAQARARSVRKARPALALTTADLLGDGSLSIAELMTIVPGDDVSTMADEMLVENMKWALSQSDSEKDWLATYFGEEPPVLTAQRQDRVNQSLGWYQGDFGKAYLGWAFANYAGPNPPSVKLSDVQKLKLNYFLQTGMAKTQDFNVQQNGIYLDAFVVSRPRLQAYIADGGDKWAQTLYAVITSPPQLILMVNRIYATGGLQGAMTPANNFATLLSALQASGALAQQYMQQLVAAALSNSVTQTTFKDKDLIMEWLPDFLQAFLNQMAVSGSVPEEAKLAAQQLQELLGEMGGSMTKVAAELADFVINANGANILQKTQNAETAFAQKFPRFAKVGEMLFFAGWSMGVIMVVKAFQNWKELEPEDKAKAVLSAVQLGLSALDVVPQFITGLKNMGADGWKKFTEWRNGPEAQEEFIELNEVGGEDWVKNGASETTPLFDAAEGTIDAERSTWGLIFGAASKVVAVVGVVVSAAFAVLSTIDFVKDILSGKPITQIVFDGIMAVTNIAMTVALVLDLVLATTVFAMAAAVLAIVGVVVAIIALFVVKPQSPIDELMRKTIIPFVDGLGPQTPPPGVVASVQLVLA